MIRSRVVHCIVVVALLMAAGAANAFAGPLYRAPISPAAASSAAVSASGTVLRLNGNDWWPSGVNAPQLLTRYSINDGCGAEVDLNAFFAATPPNGLVRFNLFQHLAINRNSNTFDFSAADAVFNAAQQAHRLLLPVLSPQDGVCDDGVFKQRTWYTGGWKKRAAQSNEILSFADWMRTAVKRYSSSPIVAGWELVGEPEASVCLNLACTQRSCPTDAANVLRKFADDAGAIVRNADPRRLIFAGFLGGDQCGTKAGDYLTVGKSRNIDVLSYHDYFDPSTVLPGGTTSGLSVRLQQSRQLGKPLLVGEIGALAGSCMTLDNRRAALAKKMTGQRKAGTAGGLIWAFVPDPRLTACTYDVGTDDPLFSEMQTQTQYPFVRN